MDIISTELRQLNSDISSYLSYLPKDMINIIIELSRSKPNKYNQQYIFQKIYKLRKYLKHHIHMYNNQHTIVQLEFKNKYNFKVIIIGKIIYTNYFIDIDVIKVIEYPNYINSDYPINKISMSKSYDMKFEFDTIFYSGYRIINLHKFNVMNITPIKID